MTSHLQGFGEIGDGMRGKVYKFINQNVTYQTLSNEIMHIMLDWKTLKNRFWIEKNSKAN